MLKKTHPAGSENTTIPHFKIKITEIPQEKLSNIANPNVSLHHAPLETEYFIFHANSRFYVHSQSVYKILQSHLHLQWQAWCFSNVNSVTFCGLFQSSSNEIEKNPFNVCRQLNPTFSGTVSNLTLGLGPVECPEGVQ